ncbi:MAG: Trm112 family protein [Bryobacterales bacterium]|nr:Trm112 family protein [Bryobacterales bacterium]
MAVSKDLVDILCCPLTKVPVRLMTEPELQKLNAAIGSGNLVQADGAKVAETMEEALITEDGARIYKVKESIPIMLKDQAIDAAQLA